MPVDLNAATIDAGSSGAPSSLSITQIGPYRVLELLGTGGMGQVYLGERDAPKRQVAIKLMLHALTDAEAKRRFQREMEALARLEHPGIANMFEVGTVLSGGVEQPWYAMEYVKGMPLDDYVKRHQLQPRQVIALVAQIARALHYAHQRGVIHRDIKPGNILVNPDGQAKIVDFGIARLADAESSWVDTRFGQIVGTLAYMSPEQLAAGHTVDVRSDVYSLGVVLYQLLCGELPVKLSTTSLLEAIRELSEAKRKPLGARDARFRGDLELIAETATHPDLEQRYESAAGFADDLEGYLGHRPIRARRASAWYLFSKFVRRNPGLVSLGACTAIALLVATLWSLRAADVAQAAQAMAEQKARELSTVNSFVTRMLSEADPDQASAGNLSMRQVLAGAQAAYEELPDDPGVRSATALLLAVAAQGSGDSASSLKFADRAVADFGLLAASNSDLVHNDAYRQRDEARMARWGALIHLERYDEAIAEINLALPELRSHWRENGLGVLKAKQEIVTALMGKNQLDAALKASDEIQVAAKLRLDRDVEDAFAFGAVYAHGVLLRRSGKLSEAEAWLRAALNVAVKQGKTERPRVLHLKHALALTISDQGRFQDALQLNDAVIAARRKLLGERHPSTLIAELARMTNLIGSKDLARAADLAAELMPRAAIELGAQSSLYLNALQSYAYLLEDLGKLRQAESVTRELLAAHAQRGSIPSQTLGPRNNLAMLLAKLARAKEGQALMQELLADARSSGADKGAAYGIFLSNAGYLDTLAGDRQRAVSELEQAIALLSKALGDQHPRVQMARERLAAAKS